MLLEINNITKKFPARKKGSFVHALNGVSFSIKRGETFGLVGESGSGKSTTARIATHLTEPSSGTMTFKGEDIFNLNKNQLKEFRKKVQMVFQDPYASLNPRMDVKKIVQEPLKIHRIGTNNEQLKIVEEALDSVGLTSGALHKYPHEFSGGQRQRISIARALVLKPELVILDEPISALDVSIQAQVINLFKELQENFNLTYFFISHDLRVVQHLCDQVGIMYLGRLVERSDKETIFSNPLHPYTQALLSAIPIADPSEKKERIILSGNFPSNVNLPKGCPFSTRCPVAKEICHQKEPALTEVVDNHFVACHLVNKEKE